MNRRRLLPAILRSIESFPAVALLGPRQVGKTTLARMIAMDRPRSLYLDLERPSDLAKLSDPETFLARHRDDFVILDEIHHTPRLFGVLRSLIDEYRRPGRFLLLGSASPALLKQSSESLAGRLACHELAPFDLEEAGENADPRKLWLRGGYPLSWLALDDDRSFAWREAFIKTHLERDIPGFGLRVPALSLRRFWMMLAH